MRATARQLALFYRVAIARERQGRADRIEDVNAGFAGGKSADRFRQLLRSPLVKLIDNWKTSWRLLSVQAMAVALAVQATWTGLPEALRAGLPEWVGSAVTVLVLIGLIGRLIKQDDGTPAG